MRVEAEFVGNSEEELKAFRERMAKLLSEEVEKGDIEMTKFKSRIYKIDGGKKKR